MPTSITTAPGLIHSPWISFAHADGGDDDVGLADHGGEIARARVRDRHRRVRARAAAAPSACRRCCCGRPRPRAARRIAPTRASRRMQPRGVHGTRPGRAEREQAGVDRVEAVDVLRRIDRVDARARRRCASAAAAAPGCRRPCRRRSSARPARVSAASVVSAGKRCTRAAHADLGARALLVAHVDLRRRILADEHDLEARGPAVARGAARAREPRPRLEPWQRSVCLR